MPMVPFLGQQYEHGSPDVSPQETVNLYPEILKDRNAKSKYILRGTPGTDTFSQVELGVSCRGLHFSANSVLYAVVGGNLYEVGADGVSTNRGTLGLFSSTCSMADDGDYLLIADGQKLWSLEFATNTFTDVDLTPVFDEPPIVDNPMQVKWLNNRFVLIGDDTNKYYWSEAKTLPGVEPVGALTWGALNFNTASSSADNINAITVRQNELWLFGKQSYEVHAITTDPDLPFSYRGGSASEIGCGAPNSVAQIGENIFWLGSNRAGSGQVFMSSDGYNARPISTIPISEKMAEIQNNELENVDDAVGYTYSQNGHTFYVLNMISANLTWVFDLTTGEWHKRATRDPLLNIQNRWEPIYAVYAYDKVICGSNTEGRLLLLSMDKYDEWDGRPILRLRRSPIYWGALREVVYNSFVLDIQTGVGVQTGQGSNPKCMIRVSRDGGHTWSSQLTRNLGKIGQYDYRVRLNGLGSSREMALEVSISDPVKNTWIGADLEYEEMDL